MLNIGVKIKELRKERKMTLAQVAGDRLTKGMLSLIENGKAQPSMESLHHIAKQLDIDVSDLMQSEENEKIHELYIEVGQLLEQMNKEFNETKYNKKGQEILDLLEPLIENGRLKGNNFEEARLMEIYLTSRYLLKIDMSVAPFLKVINMYEQVHAYSKVVKIYNKMGGISFQESRYEEALEVLVKGAVYIERYEDYIDDVEKLDLYYNITMVYAALSNEEKTEYYLNLALKIAKKKKILYRLNDFYRYLFFIHSSKQDAEKSNYYLKKIRAFTEIIEEPEEAIVQQIIELMYTNQIEKDYEKTLNITVDFYSLPEEFISEAKIYIDGEYAYAYWHLHKYEEAKIILEDLSLSKQNRHPIDLARIYRSFAIRALCYFKNGESENAKRDILYAMDGVKDYKETPDVQFVLTAYEKIMQK